MWGEDSSDDDRRPVIGPNRGGGLAAVPTWFWFVLAGFLVIAATAILKVPFFLIFFLFFIGRNHIGGWFNREFGSSTVQRSDGVPASDQAPTVRWGEAAHGRRQVPVRDDVADPELRDALTKGRDQAARMRRTLGGINDRNIRLRVTNLVDDADRILASLRERGDTMLTQTFNERYLAPATTILTRYTRLVSRDLTSARPVLDRVETHDLPLLQRKYDEFYEQVHRGDLIDLEVASEMLAFELEAPVNGAQSLSEPEPAGQEPPVRWQTPDARTGR